MGAFLVDEKERYLDFVRRSHSFSEAARHGGIYRKHERPFCVPLDLAVENLFPEFRTTAPAFFTQREIVWHDGHNLEPSNHLCSSQVSCVNFLFAFTHNPAALLALLQRVYPTAARIIPFDGDTCLTFEWIGLRDYLGEKAPGYKRTRGANCTSADAAVIFEHVDGTRQTVLIEWKYTENYSTTEYYSGSSGAHRQRTYLHWLQSPDSPLVELPDYTILFYEPFYQFMRQQLLADLMEKAHELDTQVVSVLHIAPALNTGFSRVTSPGLQLRGKGKTATGVWKSLLRNPHSFRSVATETLFHDFPAQECALEGWWVYINSRYAWVGGKPDLS